MNKYKLANHLYILFLGYGLDQNKTLKIQIKSLLTNEFLIQLLYSLMCSNVSVSNMILIH